MRKTVRKVFLKASKIVKKKKRWENFYTLERLKRHDN